MLTQNMQDFTTSVAVITRNRSTKIKRLLQSLKKQTKAPTEVLVVDNGSSDNTKESVGQFKGTLPIRYIKEKKIGIPYARNRALQEAKGELLAFIDDDCEATEDWVEQMINAHKKYPKSAAIQGKVLFYPKEKSITQSFKFNYYFWIWKSIHKDTNHITICDTCNVLFNMKKIRMSGVTFDSNFSRGSDVDFAKQLQAKGQHIMYEKNIKVKVYMRDTLLSMVKQRFEMGMASEKLERKWGKQSILIEETKEYEKQLKHLGNNLPWQKKMKLLVFFQLYKPFYYLGRLFVSLHASPYPIQKSSENKVMDKIDKKIMDITIAIVTRNRKDTLLQCLKSLENQSVFPHEVLIIDNHSTDSTKQLLLSRQFAFKTRYVYEKNIGVGYARNRALQEAKSKLLAFIDDDCEATQNWIEEIVAAHKEYPKAAAIQGKCIVAPQKGPATAVIDKLYQSWIHKNLNGERIYILDTANASFKLNQLGGMNFDTTYKNYCDDVDFAHRLWFAKKSIVYLPEIVVFSWRRMSKFGLLKQYYEKGKAKAAIDQKWKLSFQNGFVLLNGTKVVMQKSRYDKDLPNDTHKWNIYFQIKYYVIISLLQFFFTIGYNRQKKNLVTAYIPASKKTIPLKDITVAIITRNRAKKLQQLLWSLVIQTVIPKEILVIDNNSSDKTKEILKEFEKRLPIRYIKEKKIGIPYARNRALQETKGELLAFIDDDCEASQDWVEQIAIAHKKYPRIAAIQGMSMNKPLGSIKAKVVALQNEYWRKMNNYKKNRLYILDTKNISFKMPLIKKMGIFFDSNFSRNSDVDFGKQILAHNKEIILVPRIVNYHFERDTLVDFIKRYYPMGVGKAMLEYKWPEKSRDSLELYVKNDERMKEILAPLPFVRRVIFRILYAFAKRNFDRGYQKYRYSKNFLLMKQSERKKADFSVCIVTKDRPEDLYNCLFSLIKQTCQVREIIIVDSSTYRENTKKTISFFKNRLPIRYIYESSPGIGPARDRCIREARGKLLAFIDDDCEATEDWVEQMINAHKKYPKSAAIQGKVIISPNEGLKSKIMQLDYDRWIKYNMQKDLNFLTLDFENSSFKTKKIKQLGRLKDTIYNVFYYCEDIDYGYQLIHNNKTITYYPQAKIFSKRRYALIGLLKQRWLKGRGRAQLDIKWKYYRDNKLLFLFDKMIYLSPLLDKNEAFAKLFEDNAKPLSFFKKLLFPVVSYLYDKFYLFSYTYGRMVYQYSFKRLEKSLLPDDFIIKKKLSISVMIITKDRETIERSLTSLVSQTIVPNEVIIIDSSRKPKDYIGKQFSKLSIKYIYEEKLGFGVARNTAIKAAQSDIVATLDDDASADPMWIENIIKAHLYHPNAAAVQGRIISMPQSSPIAMVEQLHIERWFLRRLWKDNRIDIISTKNISFKREILIKKRVYFNENLLYGLYGAEDVDISYKLLRKNLHVFYEPKIVMYHWERSTIKAYGQQQWRKGASSTLIGRDWPEVMKKQFVFFPFPKFLEPIFAVFINPLTRRKYYLYPYLLSLFYYADSKYLQGRFDTKQSFRKSLQVVERKKVPVTVIVFENESAFYTLTEIFYILMRQSFHPKKIIVVNVSKSKESLLAIERFQQIFNIVDIGIQNKNILQEIQNHSVGDILVSIDGNTSPSYFWLENIAKAHKKRKDMIIQGVTKITPATNPLAVILQFNRQTLIRNSMKERNYLYWEWTRGNTRKSYYTKLLDITNTSYKTSIFLRDLKQLLLFPLERGNFQKLVKENALVYPEITIERFENRKKFSDICAYAKEYSNSYVHWAENQSVIKINHNFIKKTLAFSYFCFKNKVLFKSFLVVPYYIVFQILFFSYVKKVKHTEIEQTFPINEQKKLQFVQ